MDKNKLYLNRKHIPFFSPVCDLKEVNKYYIGAYMNNLYTAVTKKDGNWWIG